MGVSPIKLKHRAFRKSLDENGNTEWVRSAKPTYENILERKRAKEEEIAMLKKAIFKKKIEIALRVLIPLSVIFLVVLAVIMNSSVSVIGDTANSNARLDSNVTYEINVVEPSPPKLNKKRISF